MVQNCRTITPPKLLAFSSKSRMRAIHDRAAIIGYASSAINSIIPSLTRDAVVRYHEVDTVVIGSNPILAVIAANRLSSQGHNVAVALQDCDDDWPYDLATSQFGIPLIESAVGFVGDPDGSPDWRMAEFIRAMLGHPHGNISMFQAGVTLSLALRQPRDELFMHAWHSEENVIQNSIQSRLISHFRSASALHRLLSVPPGHHRTAIFAKTVVLISMVDHFSEVISKPDGSRAITWRQKQLLSFGTSSWTSESPSESAERMINDVISLSLLGRAANTIRS